jgi:DNA helicase HerA-like ATPase
MRVAADDLTMVTLVKTDGQEVLEFSEGPGLGHVGSVDADRITVVLAGGAPGRVAVSDLVAIPTGTTYLVGIVSSVTRSSADVVEVVLAPVGNFDPRGGTKGTFRPGAVRLPHVDAPCFRVDGERLGAFMQTLGADVGQDQRLHLGRYVADRATPAIADGNRLLQRHLAVLGNTGAGKSWTVSLLLDRAARLRHANVIVFDIHGEYSTLAAPPDGAPPVARRLRIAGPGDLLYGGDEVLYIPYWLLERDELLALVGNENDHNFADQRLSLGERVQTLKRSKLAELGAGDAVSTATADSPVPYRMSQLLEWLNRDETETIVRHPSGRVDPGPYAGKLGGLISRIEARIADPRYGFIFHPPDATESVDWLIDTASKLLSAGTGETGIKIVDLSEVPGPILPMVAGVLARLVYNVQFWMEASQRTPLCIICDEAHVYLPAGEQIPAMHRVAREVFEMIAKEGRKYGVCLAVVSQRPSDVSRTILSQCNNYIVMRLTNDRDQDVVSRLLPSSLTSVTGMLPMLDVGESLVIGDAVLLPMRIKLDRPRVAPASATFPYWSMWSRKASSPDAIAGGVESLVTQWRGNES